MQDRMARTAWRGAAGGLEVPECNVSLFPNRSAGLLVEEARLRDHLYYGDRHWDMLHLALYRDTWDGVADAFRGRWPDGHFDSLPE